MKKWADGKLRSETTLRLFIKYIYMYTQHWHADFMLYFTGLGAQHDGEATTRLCPNTERHIMSPSIHGIGPTFSFCSLRDINAFLKSARAECLFDKPSSGRVVDPAVEKRRKEMCDKIKQGEEVYYVREWYNNNCKFSCLFVNSATNTATRETWVNEENGTICNKFDTSQKCKDGYCTQDEAASTANSVEY
ncbi:hypothetical protein MRX96_010807 [Rhipicephalus microplus]